MVLVVAAGLAVLGSGCGGGDNGGGSTTQAVSAAPTITPPTTPSGDGTGGATTGTTTAPSTIPLPGGGRIRADALGPFRDCMQRHGGDVNLFGGGQSNATDAIRSRFRVLIRARRACFKELPPRLQRRYEQFRARMRRQHRGR